MLILQKTLSMIMLIAVGYFATRKGWLNDEGSSLLSKLVINIAGPAMMISAGLDNDTNLSNELLLNTLLLAVIFYAALIITAPLILRILRIPATMRGTYSYMYIFGNIGFMGIPLISSIYGSQTVLPLAIYNFIFNILMYTYGIYVVRQDHVRKTAAAAAGAAMSTAENTAGDKKAGDTGADTAVNTAGDAAAGTAAGAGGIRGTLKTIINAGTIGCIIALVCFLTKFQAPDFIISVFEMLSNLTAPLSMFVIGNSLSKMKFREMVSDGRLNIFILVRLILIPLIGISLIRLFYTDEMILRVFYVTISVPFASTSVIVANQYGGEQAVAARGVAFSTILSILTLPLIGALMGM